MNTIFADHVTNTAFFLSISKKQIKYLEHVYRHPYGKPGHHDRSCLIAGNIHDPDNFIASFAALERKGLVVRIIDDAERGQGHWELTKAGQLTCELLVEAGLFSVPVMSKVA